MGASSRVGVTDGTIEIKKKKKQMSDNKNLYVTGDRVELSNAVAAERTKVESVELVLPPHTNHQVVVYLLQKYGWKILDM